MSLDSDIKAIREFGGSVELDGTPCGSADEFDALLGAIEPKPKWDVRRLAASNLKNIAMTMKVNEKLPAMAKPKGYPIGYRPTLNIRPNNPHPFDLHWY